MYEEHNEETDSHAPDQRQTAQNRDWLDIIGKVGTPLAALIAALAAYYIAQPFQREITSVTLRNGREQAESKLRSDMFSSLIGPIVGSDKDPNNDIQAEREKVLVELLALNFHEYFEFKPLLESVDKKLKDSTSRQSLRSVIRRIIDRQIAGLQKNNGENDAKVYTFYVTEDPKGPEQEMYFNILKQPDVVVSKIIGTGEKPIPIDVRSPKGEHPFQVLVTKADWDEGIFNISIYENKIKNNVEVVENVTQIASSWSDLPLTDNTLFSDGNRFAMVPYKIITDGPLKYAVIKFIWFPRGYSTPRERPIDNITLLELADKK